MKKNYIPTINISALLSGNFKNKKEMKILKEIEKASINVGFFQIVGHGISKKSIKDITAVGKNFFASTKLNKMKLLFLLYHLVIIGLELRTKKTKK